MNRQRNKVFDGYAYMSGRLRSEFTVSTIKWHRSAQKAGFSTATSNWLEHRGWQAGISFKPFNAMAKVEQSQV